MNRRKIALGPGAASLILIVVILALCMMAMLTLTGARNDYNLCSRSTEMVQRVYELNAESERKLAELDALLMNVQAETKNEDAYQERVRANLPAGMTMEEDRISWTEPLDNRSLECIVQVLPADQKQRTKWLSHRLTAEEPEDDWE